MGINFKISSDFKLNFKRFEDFVDSARNGTLLRFCELFQQVTVYFYGVAVVRDTVSMSLLRLGLSTLRSRSLVALQVEQRASYHEKVLDHYENPRNVGKLDAKKRNVGTGLVGAPACGDVMKLQIEVDDDGKIIDAKFKTFGCGSAIASSSLATEWIKGKSIDQAGSIKNQDIAKELSLPPVKLHCSMLAEDAIKAALKDYKTKKVASSEQ